jgi:hypothetical protein
MVDIKAVSARIRRLSAKHQVEPLAVVALLAVHALVDVDFAQLRVWRHVAESMRAAA